MIDRDEIIEILRSVKDPETGLSVHDLGIVRFIDLEEEGGRLIITLDLNRRMPSCLGCKPIAWVVQNRIVKDLESAFRRFKGLKEIDFRYS